MMWNTTTRISNNRKRNKIMRQFATNLFRTLIPRVTLRVTLSAAVLACFLGSLTSVSAMPMFARKYGVNCATCHSSPPKLNETGYKFRVAGFRFPGEEDSDKKFNPLDYSSVRLQLRYDASRTEAGTSTTDSYRFRVQAVEAYPLTGAWGKHFSTDVKVSWISGDGAASIENAYVLHPHHQKENHVQPAHGHLSPLRRLRSERQSSHNFASPDPDSHREL